MRRGILDNYLMRETALAWLGVGGALLVIMVSTRLANVLNFAAKGAIPKDLLMQVTMLQSMRYLMILMPASLLLAIMLSLGRMYSDNEIAAMTGCGQSLGGLYRPLIVLASAVALLTGCLSFYAGPWAGRESKYLIQSSQRLLHYNPFEAGRFTKLENGRAVFYTASVSQNGLRIGKVFAQVREKGQNSIVVAQSGVQRIDPVTGGREIKLINGDRYVGLPGQGDYDVTHFKSLTLRVQPPPFVYVNQARQLMPTRELLGSNDPQDQAELVGRMAMPISVLILALLAVPLSRLRPRQGRYSRIVYGVLAYIVYANLISVAQHAVAKGQIAPWVGMWSVHLAALAVAAVLIARQQGVRFKRWIGFGVPA